MAYCTNKRCPASAMLATKLTGMGYKNVWKYPDGIDGWESNGKKVAKTK